MRPQRLPMFLARLRRVSSARDGAVAIEAALLVPFLLVAMVVLIDTVRYIRTTARMDRVAATTADLIARNDRLIDRTDFTTATRNDELGTFFLIANKVAAPSDLATRGEVIVTSITPLASGFKQNWQRTGPYGLTLSSRLGDLPPLPTGGALIVAEVFYSFDSIILQSLGVLSPSSLTIYRRAVFRPRLGALETLDPPS
ncbi:TadE/TadG family type IV pilus assembly protein [Benzoatithermus flavus]|uniref:TadE/TadG family type IV pilus assembly protein n=1 Tax=Benzoatithermus flavus TaxID=3108223 RepID=A0ABU8XP15_9PROT